MPVDLDAKPVEVAAQVCSLCHYTIFSRARHDYRFCQCGEIGIDGGFDYRKGSWKTTPGWDITLVIPASRRELYDDWNTRADKFGLIPPDHLK